MAKERRIKEVRSGNKLLAFFLGLLMGIIVILGALGGAAYYVYKSPIKKTVKLLDGGKENGDIYQMLFGDGSNGGYLAPDYAEKKVGELLKDTTTAIKALTKNGSLSDLETISPKVRDTLQKVLDKTDKYGIPLDEDTMMETPVNDLGGYAETQIKETPLNGLLKGFNDGKETEDPIMLALCYGEEGIDYVYENGQIVMLGDKKPTTLNGLLQDGGAKEQINKMPLEAIDIDQNDPIMRTLAYGSAERYDAKKDEKGNVVDIVMKQISFTWDGSKMYDVDGNEVKGSFNADTLVFTAEEGGDIYYLDVNPLVTSTATPTAEATEPTPPYTPTLTTYYAYTSAEKTKAALYKKKKVVDLTQNSSSLVDNLYLSDALNVNEKSHKVLISLAYGNEGEGYSVKEDGTIELMDGVKPRTIGELKTKNEELINGIQLKDALNITPKTHRVLISIAYGNDYIVDGNKIKCADGNVPRTLGDLSGEKGNEVINGIYLADALNITPASDNVLITLAYGKAGRDYIVEGDKFVMQGDSQPRTLADLSGDIGSLLDDIRLADVMDPEFDDPVIMYLLYGRKDIHYKEETKDGKKVATPLQQRIAIAKIDDDWKAYNPYGEELTGSFNEGKLVRELDYANGKYTVKVTEGEGEEAKTVTTVYKFDVNAPIGTLTLTNGTPATYYYLTDDKGNAVKYEGTTLGDLSGENNTISMLTKRLTLEELLGTTVVNGNFFLKHVKGETIDTLPTAIEELAITDVYGKDIFETITVTEGEGEAAKDVTYYVDKNGTKLYDVDNPPENEEEKAEKDEQRVVTGTWWYLLHNEAECHSNHCTLGASCPGAATCTAPRRCETSCGKTDCHNKHCTLGASCPDSTSCARTCTRKTCIKKYAVTEIGKLIDNMTENMKHATLFQMVNDGIVSISTGTDLNNTKIVMTTNIKSHITDPRIIEMGERNQSLGYLTISQTLEYLTAVIKSITPSS